MVIRGSKYLSFAGKEDRLQFFLGGAASAAEMGDTPGAGGAGSPIGLLGRAPLEQGG